MPQLIVRFIEAAEEEKHADELRYIPYKDLKGKDSTLWKKGSYQVIICQLIQQRDSLPLVIVFTVSLF